MGLLGYLVRLVRSGSEDFGCPLSPARLLGLLAILTLAAGCSTSGPREDPGSKFDAGPTGALECRVRGYPCSLSEVPIAVLERGDALGDEALARLEAGAPTSDVAGFLEGQSDVAEVRWDETGIWFRPKGGTGICGPSGKGPSALSPSRVCPLSLPQLVSRGPPRR